LPDEARLIAAFFLALGAAFAATPAAIAVAGRTDFHDHPVGYKGHSRPTPYLGGAAVLGGFLVAAALLGGEFARLSPIVGCTCALWALGTLDDRLGLGAWPRVTAECIAAMVLWATGLGWNVFPGGGADLALTVAWVVGLVNAFNLIDNMDGAAATIAAVTSVAVGGLAVLEGDVPLAILVFGLAGACLGFLPYNLASPARIFLGDGGSLPIGFVIAASLMAVPMAPELGLEHVLAATLLVGVPVLDTTLVSVSRRRAGVSLWTGGRDHLTHRLQTRLGTARTVALSLGAIQAGLGAVAVSVVQFGRGSVLAAWSIWFVVVAAAVALLETRSWVPVREPRASPHRSSVTGVSRAPSGSGTGPSPVEVVLIAFIAISCGLSPFLYGFYEVSVWGPIALGTLAALLGLLIARPAVPRPAALIAAAALAGLWLWALISVGWSESADQAMTEANRSLLYAALFGVLVLLLSDDRLSAIVVGTGAAAILVLGLYIAIRLLAGSGGDLFFGGRLSAPLGYVNGQAGYLVMGVWPLVALAERARRPASRRCWPGRRHLSRWARAAGADPRGPSGSRSFGAPPARRRAGPHETRLGPRGRRHRDPRMHGAGSGRVRLGAGRQSSGRRQAARCGSRHLRGFGRRGRRLGRRHGDRRPHGRADVEGPPVRLGAARRGRCGRTSALRRGSRGPGRQGPGGVPSLR
jgi:UDP-GlcNAc:undecaprenyl-phosphate GlcNAc-1-phosphate transferase